MATMEEYSTRLRPMLQEALREIQPPPTEGMVAAEEVQVDELSDKLGGLLEVLEQQHMGATTHVQSLLARETTEAWDGDGELAFLLYFLKYPPPELNAAIDAHRGLRRFWNALATAAPAPAFTPEEFESLRGALASGGDVYCNKWGDIYGFGTYEQLDWGWAWTLLNYMMNWLPKWADGWGVRDFVPESWTEPVMLQPGKDGKVCIAVIGDWGSGQYQLNGLANPKGPACAVMEMMSDWDRKPDYIIHLGDTYYAGTGPSRSPSGEEGNNLVDILGQYSAVAKAGKCFTLNSNHEMYGGAHGYFDVALSHPLFSAQRGCSYFALEFGNCVIAGIDSAYFDPSILYMRGGLGDRSKNPQYAFLQQIAQMKAKGKKVILMSHHTGISTDGARTNEPLWSDVTATGGLEPNYWYWGHTHLGMAYNERAVSGAMKTRCIGHGSMPFAIPPGMKHCPNVDWYADTRLSAVMAALEVPWDSAPRAANGFAVLTLEPGGTLTEETYHIGGKGPIWSTQSP